MVELLLGPVQIEGVAHLHLGPHGPAKLFHIQRRGRIAEDVGRGARMGLEARHGRTPVVQEDHGEGRPLVDGVGQGREGGMEEGGVAADGQDGLIHAEVFELAEAAGNAAARSHGVEGLDGAEAGGEGAHDIAADVAADESPAAVQFQGVMDGPVGGAMGAAGAEGHPPGRCIVVCQFLELSGKLSGQGRVGD